MLVGGMGSCADPAVRVTTSCETSAAPVVSGVDLALAGGVEAVRVASPIALDVGSFEDVDCPLECGELGDAFVALGSELSKSSSCDRLASGSRRWPHVCSVVGASDIRDPHQLFLGTMNIATHRKQTCGSRCTPLGVLFRYGAPSANRPQFGQKPFAPIPLFACWNS